MTTITKDIALIVICSISVMCSGMNNSCAEEALGENTIQEEQQQPFQALSPEERQARQAQWAAEWELLSDEEKEAKKKAQEALDQERKAQILARWTQLSERQKQQQIQQRKKKWAHLPEEERERMMAQFTEPRGIKEV